MSLDGISICDGRSELSVPCFSPVNSISGWSSRLPIARRMDPPGEYESASLPSSRDDDNTVHLARYSTRDYGDSDFDGAVNVATTRVVAASAPTMTIGRLGSSDIDSKLASLNAKSRALRGMTRRPTSSSSRSIAIPPPPSRESSYSETSPTMSSRGKKVTFDADLSFLGNRQKVTFEAADRADGSRHVAGDDRSVVGNIADRPNIVTDDSRSVGSRKCLVDRWNGIFASSAFGATGVVVPPSGAISPAASGTTTNDDRKNNPHSRTLAMKVQCEMILAGYTMTRDRCPKCTMALLTKKPSSAIRVNVNLSQREECAYCPIEKLRPTINEAASKRIAAAAVGGGGEGMCPISDAVCIEIAREQGRGGTMTEGQSCVECGGPELFLGDGSTRCVVCDVLRMKLGDGYRRSIAEGNDAESEAASPSIVQDIVTGQCIKSGDNGPPINLTKLQDQVYEVVKRLGESESTIAVVSQKTEQTAPSASDQEPTEQEFAKSGDNGLPINLTKLQDHLFEVVERLGKFEFFPDNVTASDLDKSQCQLKVELAGRNESQAPSLPQSLEESVAASPSIIEAKNFLYPSLASKSIPEALSFTSSIYDPTESPFITSKECASDKPEVDFDQLQGKTQEDRAKVTELQISRMIQAEESQQTAQTAAPSADPDLVEQEIVASKCIKSDDIGPPIDHIKLQDQAYEVVSRLGECESTPDILPYTRAKLLCQLKAEFARAKESRAALELTTQSTQLAATGDNALDKIITELERSKQDQFFENIVEGTTFVEKAASDFYSQATSVLDDILVASLSHSYSISQQEVDATANVEEHNITPTSFLVNTPFEVDVYHLPEVPECDPSVAEPSEHNPPPGRSSIDCCAGSAAIFRQNKPTQTQEQHDDTIHDCEMIENEHNPPPTSPMLGCCGGSAAIFRQNQPTRIQQQQDDDHYDCETINKVSVDGQNLVTQTEHAHQESNNYDIETIETDDFTANTWNTIDDSRFDEKKDEHNNHSLPKLLKNKFFCFCCDFEAEDDEYSIMETSKRGIDTKEQECPQQSQYPNRSKIIVPSPPPRHCALAYVPCFSGAMTTSTLPLHHHQNSPLCGNDAGRKNENDNGDGRDDPNPNLVITTQQNTTPHISLPRRFHGPRRRYRLRNRQRHRRA
ncbi:hypothetical protein ACHAW5_008358 [Stephanodiscus triporus]|uniref:Uncharacterized protein n=1 Tax=Stephanodiscus triporus TaxID=2934178 RepID=A0ABD3Q970_9STRA